VTKRLSSIVLLIVLCVGLVSCGAEYNTPFQKSSLNETEKICIAYQYGLAYAPLIIVQEQNLIEEKYSEATGKEIKVEWVQMGSGADINTGMASGDIDVGLMGIAPAITGIMNNVGYRIFTNISGQEHGLMTNDSGLDSLDKLVGSDRQIALVNIGSIQHIILARALDHAGYDSHALDSNLVAMKHPDGMAAVRAGSVACHLTTNPYIYIEREDETLQEIAGITDVWSAEDSFIVGVASENLYEENQELYQAICDSFEEAINLINSDIEAAAQLTYEKDGNDLELEISYMSVGKYSTNTSGIFELAVFMKKAQFIESAPEQYGDLVFSNVEGD